MCVCVWIYVLFAQQHSDWESPWVMVSTSTKYKLYICVCVYVCVCKYIQTCTYMYTVYILVVSISVLMAQACATWWGNPPRTARILMLRSQVPKLWKIMWQTQQTKNTIYTCWIILTISGVFKNHAQKNGSIIFILLHYQIHNKQLEPINSMQVDPSWFPKFACPSSATASDKHTQKMTGWWLKKGHRRTQKCSGSMLLWHTVRFCFGEQATGYHLPN